MSTSFNLSLDSVLTLAIQTAGGFPTTLEEYERAVTLVNLLFVDWSNENVNLWKLEYTEIPVTAGTQEVTLDTSILRPMFMAIDFGNQGRDVPLTILSYNDYMALPIKDQRGRTTQVLVERKADACVLQLWYVPSVDSTLKIWALKKQDDAISLFGNTDVPSRFLSALHYGVAASIARARNDGSENWSRKLADLDARSDKAFQLAKEADSDDADFTINIRKR